MDNNSEKNVLTENVGVPPQKDVRLVDVEIVNENIALNVMVSFLTLAHKRGAFGIDESAKIWQCINIFQKPV